jgi:hypothetical protein
MEAFLPRKILSWFLAGALVLPGVSLAEGVEARDVIGVSHAAGRYNFTDNDYLNEGADRILELGSRVIKVFAVPANIETLYRYNSDWSPVPTDVVELVQRPYFQELLAKPFSTIILVIPAVTGNSQFLDGMTPEEVDAERDQMYRLAKHLLTTYEDSGKTFILQNWEGDHLLRDGLPEGDSPDAVRVQGMIDWWNVRQDGVRRARQEINERGVEVLHAAEVNSLTSAMAGRVTATNNVIPFTNCDLYSYSSWDMGFTASDLIKALDYLEAKAPDNKLFGRRNIYLGEYGMGKGHGAPNEGKRYDRIRQMTEAALGWGVRYAVYWQVYCNAILKPYGGRPRNKELQGLWLVPPNGPVAPLWQMLETQLETSLYRAAFSSFSNQYISVSRDRTVNANQWTRGGIWETFTLKDWDSGQLMSGDSVTLQAHDGQYLAVDSRPEGRVFARSSSASQAERFTIHKIGGTGPILPGDSVAFRSARNQRYLAAEVGGSGTLHAVRPDPGPAETFKYVEPGE